MHNVPYNCFKRHIRQRAKFRNIQPVRITDIPETAQPYLEEHTEEELPKKAAAASTDEGTAEEKVRILMTIKMSNGFQVHRSNIDYCTLLTRQFVTVRMTATLPATDHTP